jgi:hypothetical protein
VVWHIGEKLAAHVHHKSNTSSCSATTGESAAHLNAKARLSVLLREVSRLDIVIKCHNGHDVTFRWDIPEWDNVSVEMRVHDTRPDIVLSLHGKPVAAVEVLHSHAVDARKAAKLASISLPWIEVSAEQALAWSGEGKLRAVAGDSNSAPACASVDCRRSANQKAQWRFIRDRLAQEQLDSARISLRFDFAASRAHWNAAWSACAESQRQREEREAPERAEHLRLWARSVEPHLGPIERQFYRKLIGDKPC